MSTERYVVQHFSYLDPTLRSELFSHLPQPVGEDSDLTVRALALGATLYVPATRTALADTVRRRVADGTRAVVLDLEDAIADHEVDAARACVAAALDELAEGDPIEAAVFVRIRTVADITRLCDAVGAGSAALTGYVVPKFTAATGREFLDAVADRSRRWGRRLLVMPVLESREVLYRETRDAELVAVREMLNEYRDQVLAVRIGATDMSGAFAIRRDRDLTIYDVRVVADTIGSIVNHLARTDGTGFVVTGPVWEYFADHERLFRPMLRQTPFVENDAVTFRQQLVSRDLDGLLREVALDRANGLQGKTVIHPSHVAPVHALSVVTGEEYADAKSIAFADDAGGVRASGYANKMNELGPHRSWAEQTLRRAEVFGVTNDGITFVDVMRALAVTPVSR